MRLLTLRRAPFLRPKLRQHFIVSTPGLCYYSVPASYPGSVIVVVDDDGGGVG